MVTGNFGYGDREDICYGDRGLRLRRPRTSRLWRPRTSVMPTENFGYGDRGLRLWQPRTSVMRTGTSVVWTKTSVMRTENFGVPWAQVFGSHNRISVDLTEIFFPVQVCPSGKNIKPCTFIRIYSDEHTNHFMSPYPGDGFNWNYLLSFFVISPFGSFPFCMI